MLSFHSSPHKHHVGDLAKFREGEKVQTLLGRMDNGHSVIHRCEKNTANPFYVSYIRNIYTGYRMNIIQISVIPLYYFWRKRSPAFKKTIWWLKNAKPNSNVNVYSDIRYIPVKNKGMNLVVTFWNHLAGMARKLSSNGLNPDSDTSLIRHSCC